MTDMGIETLVASVEVDAPADLVGLVSTRRPAITIENDCSRGREIPVVYVDDSRDTLLTDFGKATMRERYLSPGESFQDRFANCVRYYADDQAHAQRMYEYISKLWVMPATPILSNGGTNKGNLISCFLNDMPDNLNGIVGTWVENIWMAAKGGGIGTYIGKLRSVGSKIKRNGKTTGAMSFTKVIDSLTVCISQGSNRRGAAAVYMDINHPEIDTFIEMRRPAGGDPNRKALNINHGVLVSNKFMEAVRDNKTFDLICPHTGEVRETIDARPLMEKLMITRLETGEPYILFEDAVRDATPEWHKRSGLYPHTSNLCVAPETRILTSEGYKVIKEVAGTQQQVWNGKEWSWAQVEKTGENQKLVTVVLSNGAKLEVTEYHKWKLQVGYGNWTTNSKLVPTMDLKPGDRLAKPNFTVVHAGVDVDPSFAYRSGFYTADGTQEIDGSYPRIYLYGDKKELLPIFEAMPVSRISPFEDGGKRHAIYFDASELAPKYRVPHETNVRTRLAWFAGLLDGDGCVVRNGDTESLQVSSTKPDFLNEVRLMLTTLGVDSKISLLREAGYYDLPDGKGGMAPYLCDSVYRLIITAGDTQRLLELGMETYRLKINRRTVQRDAHQFVTVVGVYDEGRYDDTYCFNEPKEHLGVFEGVLTGNCIEITLPTGPDHHGVDRTAVCCLIQLNVEKWAEWNTEPQFIKDVARFQDNVLQDFIDHAGEEYIKARYAASQERSIGVGVLGFHSFLQSKNIPMDSAMAKVWNRKFFKHISEQMSIASRELAEERGACPDAAEHGFMERFSYKTAIAPTASVSIICGGGSAGIDPIPANIYTHKTLDGSFQVRNKYLEKLLIEKGRNDDALWIDIESNWGGSVQHLDFLTQDEKDVFKTQFEVDQFELINLAAERQPFIDQSQSLNLFLPPDVEKRYLWLIHKRAWELKIKSMYYLRSLSTESASFKAGGNIARAARLNYEECSSCQ